MGPGAGVYVPSLAELFERVTVSDIEPAYLDDIRPLCARYGNVEPVADDITRTTLSAAGFDVILCSEVIEHIADSRAALRGMQRLLRSGGILILSTPQRYSSLEVAAKIAFLPGIISLVRLIYREPVFEMGHINLMTEREVRRQLAEAGFRIREAHKTGLYVPVLAEFGGTAAQRLEAWLEQRLRGGPLDGLLWTQNYVAGG